MADGQTQLTPSLADLDKDLSPEDQAKLDADRAAADKATADAEAAAKAEQEAKEKEAAEKAAADTKGNGTKPDGTNDDDATNGDGTDIVADAAAFWTEVNKRHGFDNFEVDYGDTDPGSPEGAYLREKALIQKAQIDLDNSLKQSDPRAYSYFLHRQEGGNDEEFFAKPSITLPDYNEFKNNVDLHKQILTRDLRSKGNAEEDIKHTIERLEKDKKLFERADAAYKGIETSEQKALEAAERRSAERQATETKLVQGMLDNITQVVTKDALDKFSIPDTKKAEFLEYVKTNLMFDGERFYFLKPVTQDSIKQTLEHEYFGFVKGNLDGLVQRRATTNKAQQFRLTMEKSTKPKGNKGSGEGGTSTYIPVSEI